MAQAHFLEVVDAEGSWSLVRVDKIEFIRPSATGLVLCTSGGDVEAHGETRESIAKLMQSAQIVLVAIKSDRKTAAAAPVAAEDDAPARVAVVRAPPPVEVPGVTDVEEAPTKKRKA